MVGGSVGGGSQQEFQKVEVRRAGCSQEWLAGGLTGNAPGDGGRQSVGGGSQEEYQKGEVRRAGRAARDGWLVVSGGL